jgi:uncharacterized protein (TIGR02231 family)
MKKILSLLLLALFFVPMLAEDVETRIPSTIKEVTVYRTRAQVMRETTAKVSQGNNLLVLSGLSGFLLNRTIIVTGEGDGILQSVKHRVSYLNTTPKTPRMVLIEDSLERLNDAVFTVNDQVFVFKSEETLILQNQQLGGDENGISAQQLREMADLYRQRLAEIRKNLRQLNAEMKDLQKKQQAYQNELNQIRAMRDQPTQEVVIAYNAKSAGNVKFKVFYMVNNATWNPFYDIRVENTTDPLAFYLKANVVNNTGIDWKNVKLNLSTANNSGDINSPVLYPWFLDLVEYGQLDYKSRAMGALAPQSNTIVLSDSRSVEEMAPDVEYAYDYTTYTEQTLALEFNIAIPYDIPANGKEHQVDIRKVDVAGTFRHFAVPKLDKEAFLVAYVKTDLLRGPGNVYFEGTFVGETYVNTDIAEDSMKISLGRDPKVLISRERVEDFTAKKTIGSTVKQSFGFEITVKNNKKEAVRMTLEDQVPVTRNKEIKVEEVDAGGATWNEETGKLTWDLELKPGETRKVRFSFEIKYPKDKSVSGL